MQILLFISLWCCILIVARAQAGTDCEPINNACAPIGKWQFSLGVGAGVRTNPVVGGDNIPLVLIPEISYQGDRFFIQNLDAGIILLEDHSQQLNLLITASYDQVFFHRWNAGNFFISSNMLAPAGKASEDEELPLIDQNGNGVNGPQLFDGRWRQLDDRYMAGLAGFEYNLTMDTFDLQLQYVKDVTGIHDGDEARAVIAKPWVKDKHRISLSMGFNWQSKAVIQYYYGINKNEADVESRYLAADGISQVVRFDWNYSLTDNWDLRVLASVRHLSDAISASPLVNDNKVMTAFVGGVYHF